MKTKFLVIVAATMGGLFTSVSARPLNATGAEVSAPERFSAPKPTSIVGFTDMPPNYFGSTVRVKLTVDEAGQAQDIRVIAVRDKVLTQSLVSALSQWKFAPARKNGEPVSALVEIPLRLVEDSADSPAVVASMTSKAESEDFEVPALTSVVNFADLPSNYLGSTVRVKLTVDEAGQVHDIRVVPNKDRAVVNSLVSAISQWKFTPARKNGVPVSATVEIPLELVES